MGATINPKLVQPSGYEFKNGEEKKSIKRWPRVNNGAQHRLVRILELATCRDAKENSALFNGILTSAWHTLTNRTKLLTLVEREAKFSAEKVCGYNIKFSGNVELQVIDCAWLCPLTVS